MTKVVIIGTCGHPARTKYRRCDLCHKEAKRLAWNRWYDSHKKVNWLSVIEGVNEEQGSARQ